MQYEFWHSKANIWVKKSIKLLNQTKFTVVIFSDKGTKQAGEVYIDVAEILNEKSKSTLNII